MLVRIAQVFPIANCSYFARLTRWNIHWEWDGATPWRHTYRGPNSIICPPHITQMTTKAQIVLVHTIYYNYDEQQMT